MPKKGRYVKFKYFERKIKSPFMIFADFESILVPDGNEMQNPEQSYTNKYQNHIACSYHYKLLWVDVKFSKPFKSCFGEDAVYNYINSMVEESKYCDGVMKKHFNKKLVLTEEDDEDFENSTKCWIYDNGYIDADITVRDHCHITGSNRGSVHRDCNISIKLIIKFLLYSTT